MTIQDDRFKRRVGSRLAQAALRKARPSVVRASNTLAKAMTTSVIRLPGANRDVEAKVSIPHYWAVYVHDGRKPFSKANYMVWYRNPRLDPRLQGGKTPRRARNIRRLSRQQWLQALRLRQEWIDQGGDVFDAPVVITKQIRRATRPQPFFDNRAGGGMVGFVDLAHGIVRPEMSRHVRASLGDLLNEKDTAVVNL